MNVENSEKLKVTSQNILVMKSYILLNFCSEYYISCIEKLDFDFPHIYIFEKNNWAGKLNGMFVLQHNDIGWKCTRDYAEILQVLNEQVHSQYFSSCESISIEVVTLEHSEKLKPSTIIIANFILVYLMKVIRVLAIIRYIFLFSPNILLQKNDNSIFDEHVGPHRWLRKAVSFLFNYLITIMSCFIVIC